jgi:hypothetical protein
MSLDPKIEKAIEKAVQKYDQPASLTKKLTAWVNAIIEGKGEDLHAKVVFEETVPVEEGKLFRF